jgi:UPF0042 nucleotide-binding protein
MMRRLVIVTGLSGAGKSQAMKSFEDLGFACIDNLPPVLGAAYGSLIDEAAIERSAVAIDVRSGGPFGDVDYVIDRLARSDRQVEVLFLDADDETIVRRYSETRRRHPYAGRAEHLAGAIALERETLAPLRDRADHIWDTSRLTHGMLKDRISDTFVGAARQMRVTLIAFGFKYGLPLDADLVFDVRFLPNPYYEPELRPLSGNDAAVAAYLEAIPDTAGFIATFFPMMDFLLPRYRAEGKSQVTVGIGCTGGRHRSIYLARRLEAHLGSDDQTPVSVVERDIGR